MSKAAIKPVIIAAAVLVLLAAALGVLLLTEPKGESGDSYDSGTSDILSFIEDEGDGFTVINNYETDRVLKFVVTNENGGYTFTRAEREGEYYWQTGDLGDVASDEAAMRRNIDIFTQLAGIPIAENVLADDLEKYGLSEPSGKAELEFDDGTGVAVSFGIRNPAKAEYIYCTIGDGKVYQAYYVNVINVFSDARPFALLQMTEDADSDSGQPERVVIMREDAGTEIELRYMSELDGISDDITITTTNSYRFVEPIRAEVDAERASGLYANLRGLEMYDCEFLEKSAENLKASGLDKPSVRVAFTYNGEERVLSLGSEFTKAAVYGGDIQCYYAMMDDTAGIFSIEKSKASWCTLGIFDSVSKRPISPYIYGCESVEIITFDGEFKFEIDAENKSISLNGEPVDSYKFRQLYSKLIGEVGDELYTEVTEGEPTLRVKFNYREEYAAIYGGASDELCYLNNDGRRFVVKFNGNTLFKVNQLYVQGIIDGVYELVNY